MIASYCQLPTSYCGLEGSLAQMYYVQRTLAQCQAIPLYGPLIFSTSKAIVSVAQVITGLARAIFFEFQACIKGDTILHEYAKINFQHSLMGLVGLIYSLVNIRTFGLVALLGEALLTPSETQLI